MKMLLFLPLIGKGTEAQGHKPANGKARSQTQAYMSPSFMCSILAHCFIESHKLNMEERSLSRLQILMNLKYIFRKFRAKRND